LAREVWG